MSGAKLAFHDSAGGQCLEISARAAYIFNDEGEYP